MPVIECNKNCGGKTIVKKISEIWESLKINLRMVKYKNLLNRKFAGKSAVFTVLGMAIILFGMSGCDFRWDGKEPDVVWDTLTVTASAYNSLNYQTGPGDPNITAWGDTLAPGMKVIAVSRDLIKKGLDHGTPVKIEGFDGIFLVKDKMHHRWKNKIDIYMGKDVQRAKEWGRKKIDIYYIVPVETTNSNPD